MVLRVLDSEDSIRIAENELKRTDPVLGKLINSQKLTPHQPRADYFASLSRSIVGQQVSVAAAEAIYSRLKDATAMKPAAVIKLRDEDIKAIGLSKQKAGYIRDLAYHFYKNPDVYNHLGEQEDEQIILELTNVKGIGLWTAQMFLMMSLARADVFAADDIGIQRAMQKLYRWNNVPPKAELEKIALKWKPYRTAASWHLWQSLK